MCLTLEWFETQHERERHRNTMGVSPKEAQDALSAYGSTAYPIAVEMAEWIYKHWSLQDIFRLSPHSRSVLLQIIEDKGIAEVLGR